MDELEALRQQAEALGVKVDGRWGVDRLRAEIDAAQEQPEPSDAAGEPDELAGDAPDQPAEPEVVDDAGDAPDDDEDDDEGAGELEVVDELPPPIRAGGHIDRGDGRGWVIEE